MSNIVFFDLRPWEQDYLQKKLSKHPETFGTGEPRGLLAPEIAKMISRNLRAFEEFESRFIARMIPYPPCRARLRLL